MKKDSEKKQAPLVSHQKTHPDSSSSSQKSPKKLAKILFYTIALLILVTSILTSLRIYLRDVIYPQIYIAEISVSGLTKPLAKKHLADALSKRLSSQKIIYNYQAASDSATLQFIIDLSSQADQVNIDQSLDQAMVFGHQKLYFKPVRLKASVNFNQDLTEQLAKISAAVDQIAIDSQLRVENDQINVTPSQNGLEIDQEIIKKQLTDYINNPVSPTELTLPTKVAYPKLSYTSALEIKKRLDQIKLSSIKLIFKEQIFTLDLAAILNLIDLEHTESSLLSTNLFGQNINIESAQVAGLELTDTRLTLNPQAINNYLQKIATEIDRPVEEPLFSFDGTRVTEFKPPVPGQKLDIDQATNRISQALLTQNQTQVILPVKITEPKNKLTNDLGIKELIGTGISNFEHSIENRIFNVNLGAKKLNGALIAPGETFSFNKTVGDISAATGFKQAYVIKSGRTVLDDGGGICQISTTLFRAVLNAGLPVVSRTAHAYRVGYYEQGFPPGLDATTYYPSVDFQFKNDTPGSILIQARTAGLTMSINLYGTSDGRISQLSRPVVLNQTPAPPELRQDDPTLPKGTVKQVDFAAAGANVVFNRTVTRGGLTLIQESFKSNYRPWQAVYLVGTQ